MSHSLEKIYLKISTLESFTVKTIRALKVVIERLIHHGCLTCVSPASIYLFNVNNRNTRIMCEIYSKLTIKTTEPRQWSHWYYSAGLIVNLTYIFTLTHFLLSQSFVHMSVFTTLSNIYDETFSQISYIVDVQLGTKHASVPVLCSNNCSLTAVNGNSSIKTKYLFSNIKVWFQSTR